MFNPEEILLLNNNGYVLTSSPGVFKKPVICGKKIYTIYISIDDNNIGRMSINFNFGNSATVTCNAAFSRPFGYNKLCDSHNFLKKQLLEQISCAILDLELFIRNVNSI